MPQRIEYLGAKKALYKYSSFPFLNITTADKNLQNKNLTNLGLPND